MSLDNNIELKILSSLENVYHGDALTKNDYRGFSMLKNEKKSFQLAVSCDNDFTGKITFDTKVKLYSVNYIKSDFPMVKWADDYFRFSDDGYYPDLLIPIENEISFKKGTNLFWVEIKGDDNSIGQNTLNISVIKDDKIVIRKSITVEIIDCKLDFNNFIYTCWFHTDCLISYYNIEAFSDEYWRITENFLRMANEYGQNCVLTPIFTPPLDTEVGKERPTVQLVDIKINNGIYSFNFDNLTKWIEMANSCGIEYFEMAHFYTQWGAKNAPKIMATVNGEYKKIFGWETKASSKEYKKFLKIFSTELKNYIEDRKLKEKILIHVSDEPGLNVLFSYAKASKLIHRLFEGYKIIDALSDYRFYKLGIVSSPIPSNNHIDKFIGKVSDLWTYYCSAQNTQYVSNRFFCNSSLRNRVLGYQLFKFNIKGFLHWGYNFYYTQLSKSLIDPYKVSDAGGKFPSGDSYVVYPAEDGTPYHSIRLSVFYDGLQDMAALNALNNLSNKNECLRIIEENNKYKLTFSDYPHSEEWLLSTREHVNSKIKEYIK